MAMPKRRGMAMFHIHMGPMSLNDNIIYIIWLVVDLPLWKIWVRQLGWWHSQLIWKVIKFLFQTTNQQVLYIVLLFWFPQELGLLQINVTKNSPEQIRDLVTGWCSSRCTLLKKPIMAVSSNGGSPSHQSCWKMTTGWSPSTPITRRKPPIYKHIIIIMVSFR